MSRIKRRNQHGDIHVDLGEPLPLAYKVKSGSEDWSPDIKNEDDEETAVENRSYEPIILKTHNVPTYHSQSNILRNRNILNSKAVDEDINLAPIDLKKRYLGIQPENIRQERIENQASISKSSKNLNNDFSNINKDLFTQDIGINDFKRCLHELEELAYLSQDIVDIMHDMQKELWSILYRTKKRIAEKDSIFYENSDYSDQTPTSQELLHELERLQNMKAGTNRLKLPTVVLGTFIVTFFVVFTFFSVYS